MDFGWLIAQSVVSAKSIPVQLMQQLSAFSLNAVKTQEEEGSESLMVQCFTNETIFKHNHLYRECSQRKETVHWAACVEEKATLVSEGQRSHWPDWWETRESLQ